MVGQSRVGYQVPKPIQTSVTVRIGYRKSVRKNPAESSGLGQIAVRGVFMKRVRHQNLEVLDTEAAEELLATLDAAEALSDLSPLRSLGLHKLKGNTAGQWARGISADTALRLSRYFGNSAQFWMNLQSRYELTLAENSIGAKIDTEMKQAVQISA